MSPFFNNQLEMTIKIIVNYFDPEKIILFGSRAKNNEYEFSDYDICVLKKGLFNKRKISHQLYKLLYPSKLAIDLIVESTEKFDELKTFTSLIYYQINNDGVVIYEKT